MADLAALSLEGDSVEDAFITGLRQAGVNVLSVDEKKRKKNSKSTEGQEDHLDEVRHIHSNLQKVVDQFRGKVNILMDKQRSEFLTAYENHVQDFHKELAMLRHRVTEIANDKAREEKVQQLNESKEFYRNEAMKLDIETNNLAKTLRALTAKIQKYERERDWLLRRLRKAKRKLKSFEQNSSDLSEFHAEDDIPIFTRNMKGMKSRLQPSHSESVISPSNDATSNWKLRFERDFQSNGNMYRAKTLPAIKTITKRHESKSRGNAAADARAFLREKVLFSYGSRLPHSSDQIPIQSLDNRKQQSMHDAAKSSSSKLREIGLNPVEELVKARLKNEALHGFIDECEMLCHRGSWTKRESRPLHEIIDDFSKMNNSFEDNYFGTAEQRLQIATNLALTPDIYAIIKELLRKRLNSIDEEEYRHPRALSEDSTRVLSRLAMHSFENVSDEVMISEEAIDTAEEDSDDEMRDASFDPDKYIESLRKQDNQ